MASNCMFKECKNVYGLTIIVTITSGDTVTIMYNTIGYKAAS